MFVAAKQWKSAAENYERGGSQARAAEHYEKAGLPDKAAPLFEASGQFYSAGLSYMAVNMEKEAMSMFQRVRHTDEHYERAANLLGELFVKKGRHNLAIKKFAEVIADKPVTLDNIEVFYNLARAYEAGGEPQQAKPLYEKIILVDFNYKDANDRLANMEGQP